MSSMYYGCLGGIVLIKLQSEICVLPNVYVF